MSNSVEIHTIDILLARYIGPVKRSDWYSGLAICTMTFKSGQFFRNQTNFWLWLRQYELESGLNLFEVARGPAGCFDHLLDLCPEDFDNGVQKALSWSDLEDASTWAPPVETKRLVCDRGTFITLEGLVKVVPGFVYPDPGPQASPYLLENEDGYGYKSSPLELRN